MPFQLAVPFPSEAEALRRHLQTEQRLTPGQRLSAVADALAAVEALSQASGVRHAQLQYHQHLEDEWQRLMREFIQQHVPA